MLKISTIIAGVALSALAATSAAAQWNVARFDAGRRQVYTTFGLDPAIVTSVGLASVGTLGGHAFQLSGEVGVVTAKVDASDFRTRIGIQTSLVKWRSMQLTGSATAIARGTENDIYRGINFGADFAGTLGIYRPRWFAAYGGGFDKSVITHVRMSEWYRDNMYADARNGWYLDAGGTYHHGVSGGVTMGRAELMTRVGLLKSQRFNRIMPPAYATLGVGVGL